MRDRATEEGRGGVEEREKGKREGERKKGGREGTKGKRLPTCPKVIPPINLPSTTSLSMCRIIVFCTELLGSLILPLAELASSSATRSWTF